MLIRAASSLSSVVSFVSMTRYTRWHMVRTLGRCVATMQVLLGFFWMMLRRKVLSRRIL